MVDSPLQLELRSRALRLSCIMIIPLRSLHVRASLYYARAAINRSKHNIEYEEQSIEPPEADSLLRGCQSDEAEYFWCQVPHRLRNMGSLTSGYAQYLAALRAQRSGAVRSALYSALHGCSRHSQSQEANAAVLVHRQRLFIRLHFS